MVPARVAEGGSPGAQRGRWEGHKQRALPRCWGPGRSGSPGTGGPSGPAGARGGGWRAGPRSGRGRVEGWSLRRSQAGLYCSALRRPERAACAGDSARGRGASRVPPAARPPGFAPRRLGPARPRPEGVAFPGGVRVSGGAVGPLRLGLSYPRSRVPKWWATQRRALCTSGLQARCAAQERGSPTSARRTPCPRRSPAPRPPAMAAARSRGDRGGRGAPP